MIWLDKYGWPVEFVKGRPVLNFFRWLFIGRTAKSIQQRGRWRRTKDGTGLTDTSSAAGDSGREIGEDE